MLIREIMTANPITVAPHVSVAEATAVMVRRKVRHLPVVDASGALVGLVSEREVRRSFSGAPEAVPMSQVMVHHPTTIHPAKEMRDAVVLFVQSKYGALPVVEDGRLVGILTPIDVMRAWLKG